MRETMASGLSPSSSLAGRSASSDLAQSTAFCAQSPELVLRAGRVQQIISGSIGFDDWEWGVDLFANDAAVFKKLIYEMRFDEVSAVYAEFGTFFVGVRRRATEAAQVSGPM